MRFEHFKKDCYPEELLVAAHADNELFDINKSTRERAAALEHVSIEASRTNERQMAEELRSITQDRLNISEEVFLKRYYSIALRGGPRLLAQFEESLEVREQLYPGQVILKLEGRPYNPSSKLITIQQGSERAPAILPGFWDKGRGDIHLIWEVQGEDSYDEHVDTSAAYIVGREKIFDKISGDFNKRDVESMSLAELVYARDALVGIGVTEVTESLTISDIQVEIVMKALTELDGHFEGTASQIIALNSLHELNFIYFEDFIKKMSVAAVSGEDDAFIQNLITPLIDLDRGLKVHERRQARARPDYEAPTVLERQRKRIELLQFGLSSLENTQED